MKQIKPEDEVTITTTYGELAKAYAILGYTNGRKRGKSLWVICSELFDDSYDDNCNEKMRDFGLDAMTKDELLNYNEYQDHWEKVLFNQKSEKDIKLEELEKAAEEIQRKIQELKEM